VGEVGSALAEELKYERGCADEKRKK